VAYSGEPTPPELAGAGNGGLGGVITHPDGSRTIPGQGSIRHDREGNAILGPREPRPIGPDRSETHEMAIRILEGEYHRPPIRDEGES
jgi:hypothetical protein